MVAGQTTKALSIHPQRKEYYEKVMKIARFFAAVAMLTATAFCVSAQQQRPAAPATPPATAPQTVAVPDSKMAMIYSDAFLDPETRPNRSLPFCYPAQLRFVVPRLAGLLESLVSVVALTRKMQ